MNCGMFRPKYEFGDVYLALLTAYAAQREGAKWLGGNEPQMRIRRGEIFIGLWFALYIAIIACANLSARWTVPMELKGIVLGVLGIFAVTGVSTGLRQSRGAGAAAAEVDRKEQMLKLLSDRGPTSAPEAAMAIGVSTATAWRTLEDLVKAGKVRQTDSPDPRNRRYTTS
jgi:hypothetical protein